MVAAPKSRPDAACPDSAAARGAVNGLPEIALGADALDRLYPSHLCIDGDFRVAGCGRVIGRLLPELARHPRLDEAFAIERPLGTATFGNLIAAGDQALLLGSVDRPDLKLKGEAFVPESRSHVILLTTPWIRDANEIESLGLTMGDFARGDATPDLMFLVSTQAMLLQNAEELTGRLKIARDEAVSASRAKSEFLANMSHELRTPLNAIIGFSEYILALGESVTTSQTLSYVKDIHESGRYLLEIVNDLLDLSRIEAGKLVLEDTDFDLVRLVRQIAHSIGPQLSEAGVRIDVVDPGGPVGLRADRKLIRQIVVNLLSNAVKFNRKGGSVTLRVDRLAGGGIEIAIADTGIGIDPAIIPELFEPFRQADSGITRRYGGTGLGLAIVKRIAGLHDGDIAMESTPGVGTIVRVRLPPSRIIAESGKATVETR